MDSSLSTSSSCENAHQMCKKTTIRSKNDKLMTIDDRIEFIRLRNKEYAPFKTPSLVEETSIGSEIIWFTFQIISKLLLFLLIICGIIFALSAPKINHKINSSKMLRSIPRFPMSSDIEYKPNATEKIVANEKYLSSSRPTMPPTKIIEMMPTMAVASYTEQKFGPKIEKEEYLRISKKLI